MPKIICGCQRQHRGTAVLERLAGHLPRATSSLPPDPYEKGSHSPVPKTPCFRKRPQVQGHNYGSLAMCGVQVPSTDSLRPRFSEASLCLQEEQPKPGPQASLECCPPYPSIHLHLLSQQASGFTQGTDCSQQPPAPPTQSLLQGSVVNCRRQAFVTSRRAPAALLLSCPDLLALAP